MLRLNRSAICAAEYLHDAGTAATRINFRLTRRQNRSALVATPASGDTATPFPDNAYASWVHGTL